MNPILKAYQEGYDDEKIFNFLVKSYPHIRKKLQKAITAGYSPKEIIGHLSDQIGTRTDYGNMSQQEIHGEKRKEDSEKNRSLLKAGLKTGATIASGLGGIGAVASAIPKIAQGIAKTAPQIGKGIAGGLMAGAPQIPSVVEAASTTAPQAIKNVVQPQISALLSKHGLLNKIESLASRHVPDVIPALIQKQIKPEALEEIQQASGMPFADVVKDYANTFLSKAKEPQLSRESLKHQIEQSQEQIPQLKMPKTVLLPSGEMGTIKGEKQGIAEIETPSGIRTRKLDEVIEEPEGAATKALEIIKSFTPEQERSSHHALSTYDPTDSSAFFVFHDGTAYKVDDVTPDEYERLSKEVDMAKTSGEGAYGAWSTGSGSRGAAYNQIVKGLRKPYRKLQVGYNAFAEFQKRVKDEEKRRKRKKPL